PAHPPNNLLISIALSANSGDRNRRRPNHSWKVAVVQESWRTVFLKNVLCRKAAALPIAPQRGEIQPIGGARVPRIRGNFRRADIHCGGGLANGVVPVRSSAAMIY